MRGNGINQSKSTVQGDQVGGDQYKYSIMEIKKELAEAKVPIRSGDLALTDFNNIDADENNTILITKLKNGGFNSVFRNHAKTQKLQALSIIFDMGKTEEGKRILNDINANLMTVINMKYISKLDDGETLRTSMSSILEDLSNIVTKYRTFSEIDEAFLEGLLYIATSRCALKWKMEEDEDDCENDSE